jgi:hypothetical protein
MERLDPIIVLRGAINGWISEAEEEKKQAEKSKQQGLTFRDRFEAACADLKTEPCPFCGGKMVDASPLEPFADELRKMQHYLYQGERFTPECQVCKTYRTNEPRPKAQRWAAENTDRQQRVFAAEVFRALPEVDEVAREQIGRGWMLRIGKVWYANDSDKDTLINQWGMKARGRSA